MKRTRSKTIRHAVKIDSCEATFEDTETDYDLDHTKFVRSKKCYKKKSDEKTKTKELNQIHIQEYSKYQAEIDAAVKSNSYEMKPKYINKVLNHNDSIIRKLTNVTKFIILSPLEIFYKVKYEEHHKLAIEEDKCSICQFNFYEEDLKSKSIDDILKLNEEKKFNYDTVLLDQCTDHFFHLECLEQLMNDKDSFKCPNCNKIYGTLTGDQPDGEMFAQINSSIHCAGYNHCGTIIIDYHFPNGKGYTGTSRQCYLPDCKEGREVLALLKVAFDRKLTFAIGTSVTTGKMNTTVWNGIHHKTNLQGGSQYFGYPDPTYFNRVKQELAAKGVYEDNIKESLESIAEGLLP